MLSKTVTFDEKPTVLLAMTPHYQNYLIFGQFFSAMNDNDLV